MAENQEQTTILKDSDIRFEKPIIAIGYPYTKKKQGEKLIALPPDVIAELKNKQIKINVEDGTITEYDLTKYMAMSVYALLILSGVRCIIATNENIADDAPKEFEDDDKADGTIGENLKTDEERTDAINAVRNRFLKVLGYNWERKFDYKKRVCVYLDFDTIKDIPDDKERAHYFWCSEHEVTRYDKDHKFIKPSNEAFRLANILKYNIYMDGKAPLNSAYHPYKNISSAKYGPGIASPKTQLVNYTLPGFSNGDLYSLDCFETSKHIISCVYGMFNINCKDDVVDFVKNIDKIVNSIAAGILLYIEGKKIDLTPEQMLAGMFCKATSKVEKLLLPIADADSKKEVALKTQRSLLPIEKNMGENGGDVMTVALRNIVTTVGTSPPLTKSYRTDSNGDVIKTPILVPGGIVSLETPTSKYETIIRDIPTGNITVKALGAYDLTAAEASVAIGGNVSIDITGVTSIQAKPEISIASGDNLLLSGRNVQILSNSISVSGNTTINGNTKIDGNLLSTGLGYFAGGVCASSFNGPRTIDKTNSQELYGYLAEQIKLMIKDGKIKVKVDKNGSEIMAGEEFNLIIEDGIELDSIKSDLTGEDGKSPMVKIPAHKHQFYRLDGMLTKDIVEVNEVASNIVN